MKIERLIVASLDDNKVSKDDIFEFCLVHNIGIQ
jgi:hypothetical protein